MYVGLDVHKRFCYGTMMNEKGEIVGDGKFSKDPRCLDELARYFMLALSLGSPCYPQGDPESKCGVVRSIDSN